MKKYVFILALLVLSGCGRGFKAKEDPFLNKAVQIEQGNQNQNALNANVNLNPVQKRRIEAKENARVEKWTQEIPNKYDDVGDFYRIKQIPGLAETEVFNVNQDFEPIRGALDFKDIKYTLTSDRKELIVSGEMIFQKTTLIPFVLKGIINDSVIALSISDSKSKLKKNFTAAAVCLKDQTERPINGIESLENCNKLTIDFYYTIQNKLYTDQLISKDYLLSEIKNPYEEIIYPDIYYSNIPDDQLTDYELKQKKGSSGKEYEVEEDSSQEVNELPSFFTNPAAVDSSLLPDDFKKIVEEKNIQNFKPKKKLKELPELNGEEKLPDSEVKIGPPPAMDDSEPVKTSPKKKETPKPVDLKPLIIKDQKPTTPPKISQPPQASEPAKPAEPMVPPAEPAKKPAEPAKKPTAPLVPPVKVEAPKPEPKPEVKPTPKPAPTPAPKPAPTPTPKPEKKEKVTQPKPQPKPESKPPAEVKPAPVAPLPEVATPVEVELDKSGSQTSPKNRPVDQAWGKPNAGKKVQNKIIYLTNSTSLLEVFQKLGPVSGFSLMNPKRARHYGTYDLVEMIANIGEWIKSNLPSFELKVSSLSAKNGGSIGHSSHKTGMDADLAYVTKTPKMAFMDMDRVKGQNVHPDFDGEAQWKLFKSAFDMAPIEVIYVNRKIKNEMCLQALKAGDLKSNTDVKSEAANILTRLVVTDNNHGDHWHVRMDCNYLNKVLKVQRNCISHPQRYVGPECQNVTLK